MAIWVVVNSRDNNEMITSPRDSKSEAIEEAETILAETTGVDKPWKAWTKEGYKLRKYTSEPVG